MSWSRSSQRDKHTRGQDTLGEGDLTARAGVSVLNNLLMGWERNSNRGCTAVRAIVTHVFQTGATEDFRGVTEPIQQ